LLLKIQKKELGTLIDVYKAVEPNKYDFDKDIAGFYRWYEDAKEIF
jgi:hypothetical protein